ncbi:RNA polymerase II transcription elongation factor-domain-containing protein [Xylaria longipes]|nr:RNA polymerase II transcription elongation factor-domain-containing protein [Xylaria longipes]
MASLATGIVDPTKVGKYRVVLSDALLGKDPKELYTGIRYNHKPILSSNTAPHQARIKPTTSTDSSSASSSSYELSYQDDGGRYTYQGTRGHEENKYVLIFDPEKEVFVLHRVDSMFNMNLVRTPTNTDPEDLRQEYPQLEAHRPSRAGKPTSKAPSSKPAKPKKSALNNSKPPVAKKAEPPKPAPSKKVHHDSEDESSDDDLLTIEDPGGAAPASNRDFSPGFIDHPRRFSDFIQQNGEHEEEEEEDDDGLEIEVEALNDADGEEEEEEDDDDASENFKLPSPIHRQMMAQNINGSGGHNSLGITTQSAPEEQVSDEDEEEEMEDVEGGGASIAQDDMAVDLEAMLIAELEREESEVSEED